MCFAHNSLMMSGIVRHHERIRKPVVFPHVFLMNMCAIFRASAAAPAREGPAIRRMYHLQLVASDRGNEKFNLTRILKRELSFTNKHRKERSEMQKRLKLFLIRKFKGIIYRVEIHRFVGLLEKPLLTMSYLIKASRWIAANKDVPLNDFYTPVRDYNKRYRAYKYLFEMEKLDLPVDYLEFGVFGGKSFQWWASANKHPESRFVGFDTFSGLPEDWDMFKKGDMSVDGNVPQMDDARCSFEAGLFQDTLPGFLYKFERRSRLVIHMDADLYSSTLYVLTSLAPILRKGDIILFDEFNIPLHEFRAFTDFVESYYIKTKLLTAVNNYYQVSMKIM